MHYEHSACSAQIMCHMFIASLLWLMGILKASIVPGLPRLGGVIMYNKGDLTGCCILYRCPCIVFIVNLFRYFYVSANRPAIEDS